MTLTRQLWQFTYLGGDELMAALAEASLENTSPMHRATVSSEAEQPHRTEQSVDAPKDDARDRHPAPFLGCGVEAVRGDDTCDQCGDREHNELECEHAGNTEAKACSGKSIGSLHARSS